MKSHSNCVKNCICWGKLNSGKIKLDKYCIEPKAQMSILEQEDFNIVHANGGIVFLSKKPMRCYETLFWVTIYIKNSTINKIELSNADEKYSMNYNTMDRPLIEKLREENRRFLQNICGEPTEKTLSGERYEYTWGTVCSYFDNKSAESGIIISYFDE